MSKLHLATKQHNDKRECFKDNALFLINLLKIYPDVQDCCIKSKSQQIHRIDITLLHFKGTILSYNLTQRVYSVNEMLCI